MNTIQKFLRDENAFILEWIIGLFGLLLLIAAYALFAPINNILIVTMAENGAPIAQLLWVRTMFRWEFLIVGILCLIYPFASSYRHTYDQGQRPGGW